MKRICILGSTGSIGTQALDVIRCHADKFEAHTLTAGTNAELLIRQAREFLPDTVVIADENKYECVREALEDLPVKVFTGTSALCDVTAASSIDLVLTAMVGFAGLRPTVHALKAGKAIALANKETLVVAGELITRLAHEHQCPILPVDSEHSAIFQALNGEYKSHIARLLLTASGGPFRHFSIEQLQHVTLEQALRHPNWNMGAKITIDSSTMMNKGFEMIEAKWLFGVSPHDIEILIHPESIIHSAIEFEDGAIIAQLGTPDMRLPVQYAFTYPNGRLPIPGERLDLCKIGALHFEQPNQTKFPCLRLAYEATERGKTAPCVLNAANEVANLAFREGRIGFMRIPAIVEETLHRIPLRTATTLEDYLSTDKEARAMAESLL